MSKNIIQGVRENWTIIVTFVTVVGFTYNFYYQQSALNIRVAEIEVEVISIRADVNRQELTQIRVEEKLDNITDSLKDIKQDIRDVKQDARKSNQ